jgi:alkyl hydroperoxide reductase subunit AhpC
VRLTSSFGLGWTTILTYSLNTEISLSTYTQAKHWLILIFFPKAWSFICPIEVTAFSSRLQEFIYSRSCAAAFASTDSENTLRAWNSTSEMEGGLGGRSCSLDQRLQPQAEPRLRRVDRGRGRC